MSKPRPSSFKRSRRAGRPTAAREVAAGPRRAGLEFRASAADPLASILPFSLRVTHVRAAGIISALALAVFLNSLGYRFVADDRLMIEQNPMIRDLANLKFMFSSPYWPREYVDGMYRPLLVVTYALNFAVSNLRPFGYHLVNVLLHAGNSALVYGVAWQLFRQQGLAVLAAVAFALHPIHTEVVANVVGRAELLAAAFVFIAWLLHLQRDAASTQGFAQGRSPVVRPLLLVGSIFSFALALLSKEHAIVLPGLLLLSDGLRVTQRMPSPSLAVLWRALWRPLMTIYPAYLAVAGGFVFLRSAVVGTLTMRSTSWVLNPLAGAEYSTQVLTAAKVLGKYLWLLLVPNRLSADYSYNQVPLATSVLEPDVLVPLLGAGAVAWMLRRRAPAVAFGLLAFLVSLAPVSNIFFLIGTIMAERHLYLPSFGFCLALAAMIVLAVERLASLRAPRWLPSLPVAAFVLLLVFYAGKTVVQNQVWATDLNVWRATTVTSPNSAKAHFSLAWALEETGDLEGAKQALERALRIHPRWFEPQHFLGVILSKQGRWDEAIEAHRASIRLNPEVPEPYYNLARAYEMKGMLSGARGELVQAVAAALPRDKALLYLGIGDFSFRHGELSDAERWFERATRSYPDDVKLHLYLGKVYWKLGRLAKANAAFKRALQLDPSSSKAHQGLGLVLRDQGKRAEAQQEFQLAEQLRRRPENEQREATSGPIASPGLDPR